MDVKKYEKLLNELEEQVNNCFDDNTPRLTIDIYNLEKECAEHSGYYSEVKKLYANVNSILHQTQLIVKEVKAELSIKIRNDPEDFGIVKISEGAIMAVIDSSEETKNARHFRMTAERLNIQMQGLVDGFEHRRSMLNNEVQLYLSKLSDSFKQNNVDEMEKSLHKKGMRKLSRVEK